MRFERMFHYDADDGGAGGGASATQPDPQAQETPPSTTSTGEGQQPGGGGSTSDLRLSTAQLSDRLERARGAERTALLQQLGFESLEAAQQAIQAGQQAIQAQMSEQERQQQALQQANERAQALERQAQEAQAQAQQALLQSQAVSLMSGRFANPQAAFRLLDISTVKAENGTFTGLKEAIEQLAAAEPWTLAQPGKRAVAPPIGATNPAEGGEPRESEAEKKARYFGNAGGGADFFKGGGVKAAVVKGQKP